jgi:hypothetical protein
LVDAREHHLPAGIFQRDELAAVRQRDRIVKASFPTAISHWTITASPS